VAKNFSGSSRSYSRSARTTPSLVTWSQAVCHLGGPATPTGRPLAPRLAERYTVVATDLHGYGDSGKPPSTTDHEPYSMRAIGRDQIEVMRHLGHNRFSVVGHDRGARCAYRLALDHPDAVVRLAVMDVVPVGDAYDRADKNFSLVYWQWSFLAAPEPVPEQFINAAPANLVNFMLDTWPEAKDAFPAEVRAEYIEKFRHLDTMHAICEEFRAAATRTTSRTRRTAGTEDRLLRSFPLEPARFGRETLR
jgi:pimeloyl-ACP methyl ester carboxylesterase